MKCYRFGGKCYNICDYFPCKYVSCYEQSRADAIDEFRELIIARIESKNRGLYVIEAMYIAEQLKENKQ